MSGLEIVLVIAALLAGLAGTWSPCGFSMIETIGPAGHDGGRPTTIAACITFTLGALVGGVLTFGLLAALGAIVQGADQRIAYIAAAALALLAAVAELRGVPILPQLRRQLPEHWRRVMPMPVAAGLYGVLLGLGFTTFVLTFGVFALAGIVFAVGEPAVGVAVGLAFGIGRAVPIALIAPDRRSASPASRSPRRWRSARRSIAACASATGSRWWPRQPPSSSRPRPTPRRPDRSPVPTRRSPASGSSFSDPTAPGSCAATATTSRFPATIRRSAAAGSR